MDLKGKSLTLLAATLLLCRHAVVITTATSMTYQRLESQTRTTIGAVDKTKIALITQYSINESNITEKMTKWYFGVSDCWNYSMTEDERLTDNYIRLKIFKHQSMNISRNVVVPGLGNLQRAVRLMRKKLGYPRVNGIVHHHHKLPTVPPQEQGILQVVFLSTVDKNLNLMLNDFQERIPTKA
ncbi:Hypothetical predicted protein [Paramuricea clavata]|uniref:Uncharacterized protein n=1 Tax=Paramuricea clavata TaxID=317549 RepID=A0A7D9IQC5_PARCT|nr:Hypothetical predicted protein [Paramuricea clavata]